jgi:hypothetical protein
MNTRLICARCRLPVVRRPWGGFKCPKGHKGAWIWLAEAEVPRQGELFR